MASIKSRLRYIADLLNSDTPAEGIVISVVFAIAVIADVLWFYPLPSFFDLSNYLGFICLVLILVIVFGIATALNESRGKRQE